MVGLVLAAALGDNDVGHHARQDQGQSGKQEEVVVGQQKAVDRKQANARGDGDKSGRLDDLFLHVGKSTTNNLANQKKVRTFAPHFDGESLRA